MYKTINQMYLNTYKLFRIVMFVQENGGNSFSYILAVLNKVCVEYYRACHITKNIVYNINFACFKGFLVFILLVIFIFTLHFYTDFKLLT